MAGTKTRGQGPALVVAAGWVLAAVLPWYWIETGTSLAGWPLGAAGSALLLGLAGKAWLLPMLVPLALATALVIPRFRGGPKAGFWLAVAGALLLAAVLGEGFAIDHRGWTTGWLSALFGAPGPKQAGFGVGGFGMLCVGLLLISLGLAERGWCRGDAFIVTSIAGIVALILLFLFFPIGKVLVQALKDAQGEWAPGTLVTKISDGSIWGLGCLGGGTSCGVAWNTLVLGAIVGAASTALGLCFALIATRTQSPLRGPLRILSVLPIITPPFVIGLALILLFGRSGAITALMSEWFGIPRSRWIYGLPGVALAQVLAFTPIAYLVLIGVVQGISPTLEEAAQTLRASRWTTFRTVTWPLMRPGIANAFLIGFVESMADFGNPLVLGGNFEVLSTKIFFAVVGAATDESRAAVLALVLLVFTLGAFWIQQAWVGKKSYTTLAGKGDGGLPTPLPRGVAIACYGLALPWALFTIAVYALILIGGFVKALGRDYTPTLTHLLTAFRIDFSNGIHLTGSAWDSFLATLWVAGVAAPFTAAIGILTAWLLNRERFAGKRAFEFGTLLSFAIPGTVVGVSYILAFNVPPIEITGTGLILVLCFVFRNMPVGVRSGSAALSQIDKSLDEASITLGASAATTLRKVILPLIRPAITAALVYSFVRAMTAISAVIFLVSARYNMATTYIVGRVEAGEFGLAIAYSSVLIVAMLVIVLGIEAAVGERRLGRRSAPAVTPPA